MKLAKKIGVISLAAAMTLSLVACGSKTETTSPEASGNATAAKGGTPNGLGGV